jgi:uncharacterized protein DUF5666
MGRFLVVAILSSAAFAQVSSSATSQSAQDPGDPSAARVEGASIALPDLPAAPRGKSTVIGGAIRGVDTVRDQFTLNVYGGKSLKVLFDARTQVYRDGLRTSVRDLRAGDHVSVETVLDGTTVFARSIHMLSMLPEGECQGQVLNYNSAEHELTILNDLSREPVKLRVPAGTAIVRSGQAASNEGSSETRSLDVDLNLAKGTLVSVNFRSDNKGHGVASQISILATPGATFVFVGNIASLDMPSGLLAVIDPRDDKRYQIFFDATRLPISHDLHEGADVTVTTEFDGGRYVANAITVNSTSSK